MTRTTSPSTEIRHGTQAKTLMSAFGTAYELFGDAKAIRTSLDEAITYRELGVMARRVASGLASLGVAPGDRVMVVSENRWEQFVVDHALSAGGFVRTAVSHRLHPSELAHIARDCEPSLIFTDTGRALGIKEAIAEAGLTIPIVSFDAEPPVPIAATLSDLLTQPEVESPDVQSEDLAWLSYTSGTTGQPKGVMWAHRTVLGSFRNLLIEVPPITTDDTLLHVAPLTHLSGHVGHAYGLRGAAQVVLPKFDPETTLRAAAEYQASVLPLVPTMVNMILPELESRDYSLDELHTIIYGGSAISAHVLSRAVAKLGLVFVQGYGLSEACFPLATLSKVDHAFEPGSPPPAKLSSAGRPTPFVEMRIRTAEDTDAPAGEEGEIQVRADVAMLGYYGRPAETQETLLADGWIATGDVGRFEDGYLYVVDRKKDMIVSGGFNIYPAEVERAIASIDGILEVAVVGVPDERWGEAVHAVVAIRDGFSVIADDIDLACRSQIASYKRPRSVEFVDALPKTGTGKVQRYGLRQKYWAGKDRRVGI